MITWFLRLADVTLRVFCVWQGGVLWVGWRGLAGIHRLLLWDWFYCTKNVKDNSYAQKESSEKVLELLLQGQPWPHDAALRPRHCGCAKRGIDSIIQCWFPFSPAWKRHSNVRQTYECLVFDWIFCLGRRNVLHCSRDWKEQRGSCPLLHGAF